MKKIACALLLSTLTSLYASKPSKEKAESRQTEIMRTVLQMVTDHREALYIKKVQDIATSLSLKGNPDPAHTLISLDMYETLLKDAQRKIEWEMQEMRKNKQEIQKLSNFNSNEKSISLDFNGEFHSLDLPAKSTLPQQNCQAHNASAVQK